MRLIHRPPFPVLSDSSSSFHACACNLKTGKERDTGGGNHQNLVRFTDRYLQRPAVSECGYLPSHSIGHDAEVISQSASTGVIPVYFLFPHKKRSMFAARSSSLIPDKIETLWRSKEEKSAYYHPQRLRVPHLATRSIICAEICHRK